MDWGTHKEANGLLEYQVSSGDVVQATGFWQHPHLDWIGGSPDGLISTDGIVEIKCPYTQKLYPEFSVYYYCQVNALLEIMGREWCDFCVWTPNGLKTWRVKANKEAWERSSHTTRPFGHASAMGTRPPTPGAR
jgi:hypothetical protein